jgi:hypothetical protein
MFGKHSETKHAMTVSDSTLRTTRGNTTAIDQRCLSPNAEETSCCQTEKNLKRHGKSDLTVEESHHYICLHHASVFVSVSKHPFRDNKTFRRDDVHDFPQDTGKTTIFSQILDRDGVWS